MTKELISSILAATSRGWLIFPLAAGSKIPLQGPAGFKDSVNDTKAALKLFEGIPHANIGIDCGRSGLVVVDIDPRNGGTIEKAVGLFGPNFRAPMIPVVGTAGGGTHHYFAVPQGK